MNVSSLSPWLSGFHAVQFSVILVVFVFKLLCEQHGVSTYASILAGSESHCGFDLHFLIISKFEYLFIYFWPFIYIPCRKSLLSLLPMFNWVINY